MDKATRDEMSVQHQAQWRLQEDRFNRPKAPADDLTALDPVPLSCGNGAGLQAPGNGTADLCGSPRSRVERAGAASGDNGHQSGHQLSPPVAESDLPLRDRLQKIQQLLLQAGVSPVQALSATDAVSNSPSAANAAGSVDHARQQQQQRTVNAVAGVDYLSSSSGLTFVEQQVASGSGAVADDSEAVTTPMWETHGVTYDEMICLVSPSPSPVQQRLQSSKHQDSLASPVDAEPSPGIRSEALQDPASAPGSLVQQNHSPHQLRSPVSSVTPRGLQQEQQQQQSFRSQLVLLGAHWNSQSRQSAERDTAQVASPQALSSASGQGTDGSESELSHSGVRAASCQQSPVSTGSTHQTKKRSRSVVKADFQYLLHTFTRMHAAFYWGL